MFYLLNPKIWAAAILLVVISFTHYTVYKVGKGSVQAKWDREKAELLDKAVKAEQEARKKEQGLVAARQNAENKYVEEKRKAASAAVAAQSALNSLRLELSSTPHSSCSASSDPTAASRAASGARLERDLLGACATALTDLATEADRLEAIIVGLQRYVKNVCLAKN